MSVLTLTITQDYVPNWDVWHGLREFLQNTIDADSIGHPMEISYSSAKKQVTLTNEGIQLDRDALLLGYSNKRGDTRQIGEFGEGFKLAMLCLLRRGAEVTIHSGTEVWTPFIGRSDDFKMDLLQVRTRKVKEQNSIEVRIKGIMPAAWADIKARILHLTPPKTGTFIRVGSGQVLTGEMYKKQLYCKGIYVGSLPGEYTFGYDLHEVKLDRDRAIADPWSMRYEIKRMLNEAVKKNNLSAKELMAVLDSDSAESDLFADQYMIHDSEAADKVAEEFTTRHGENAVPVVSIGESQKVEESGMKAVVVGKGAQKLIEQSLGSMETRTLERTKTLTTKYSLGELEGDEKANLLWAADLCTKVFPNFSLDRVNVVDFCGSNVKGIAISNGEIRLARCILGDKVQTLATMMHEASHDVTLEHSVLFRTVVEWKMAELVVLTTCGKEEWKKVFANEQDGGTDGEVH